MKLFAHSNGHRLELDIQHDRDRLIIRSGEKEIVLAFDDQKSSIRTAFLGQRRIDFGWDRRDSAYSIHIEGIEYRVEVRDPNMELVSKIVKAAGGDEGAVEVRAPIPGLITKVLLKPGEPVQKDQPVLCLDAMKLENEIAAPREGKLTSLSVTPGQPVEKGQLLFIVG